MPLPITATVALLLAVSAAIDVRVRRIPNLLSAPAIVAGVALNALYCGSAGIEASLAGLAVATAILLPPFALGGVGGGDVKVMGAAGALVGPRLALSGLALGMVLGGVVMAVELARRGRLAETLFRTGAMVAAAATTRSLAPLRVAATATVALPYGLPLALGMLAAVALRGSGPLTP